MSCSTAPCCPFYGNIDQSEQCQFNPGGSVNIFIARACDVDVIAQYTNYYQGASQAALFTTAFGSPIPEYETNRRRALFPENAVNDIIMLPYGAPGPAFTPWFKIDYVKFSAGVVSTLVGGDGAGAKYWNQTASAIVPLVDQDTINKMNELAHTEIMLIIETKIEHKAYAEEVLLNLGGTGTPVIENRFYLVGHQGGLTMETNEFGVGRGQDDVSGFTLTFSSPAQTPALEILPDITNNYNVVGGTPGPGKYISAPYNAAPYNVRKPKCNLMTKLLLGAIS